MLERPRDEVDLTFVIYEVAADPPLGTMILELLFNDTPGCYLFPKELALY